MPKKRKAGKRRARNEGSVSHRESDGRWVATLVVGVEEDGRPKRKVFYGLTQAEAVDKRDEFQRKLTLGHVQIGGDAKQTVAQYLDGWFAALRVKKTTKRRYGQIIDYRIKPFLGGYRLEKLAERQTGQGILKRWLAWLEEQKQAAPKAKKRKGGKGQAAEPPKTPQEPTIGLAQEPAAPPTRKITERGQEMALRVLNKALSDAEVEDIIAANPLRKVKAGRPRPSGPETRSMTSGQVAALFRASLGTAYHPLYVMALDSGMREGELFALLWDDFDLEAGTVSVKRELLELNGKVELSELKTKSSKRLIHLTPHTVTVLRAYQAARKKDGYAETLVFTAAAGGYLRRPNLAQRHFQPTLARAGLPHFKFHELRHTCASLLLMAGVPIKVVSERLGHASVQVTLKTFAHVLPGMQEHAAEKMDVILSQKTVSFHCRA